MKEIFSEISQSNNDLDVIPYKNEEGYEIDKIEEEKEDSDSHKNKVRVENNQAIPQWDEFDKLDTSPEKY